MFDFHLERIATDDELAEALRKVFNVEFVRLVEEITSPDDFADVQLLVVRWMTGGDFPLHVRAYPQGAVGLEEHAVAQRLVDAIGTRCLITDDAPDPWSWVLVDAKGTRAVRVDPASLEKDELVLSEARA